MSHHHNKEKLISGCKKEVFFGTVDMHKSHCQKRQHFKIPSCMTPNSLPPFTMQELLAHNAIATPREERRGRRISKRRTRRCRPIAFRREIFVTRASRDGQIVSTSSVWSVCPPVRQSCIIGRRRRRPWRDPNGRRTEKPFGNIFANECATRKKDFKECQP